MREQSNKKVTFLQRPKEEPSTSNHKVAYEDYDDGAFNKNNIMFKDSINLDSEFVEFIIYFNMLSYDEEDADPGQADLLVHTRSQVAKDKAKVTQDQGPSHQ